MTRTRTVVLLAARLLRAGLLAVDCLILANVGLRFVIGGPRGVTGYFEHIALEGVNVFAIKPSQARQLVVRSTVQILAVYGMLAAATLIAVWAVRRLRASAPGSPAA